MNLQRLNAMKYDKDYDNMLVLDTLIHSEDWDKRYEQYKIYEHNRIYEQYKIKNRAAKLIQSWWFQSNGIL
jgi:hypothetical protein